MPTELVSVDDDIVDATEQWFIHRGLPHFISEYNAAQDVWARAVPALTGLFLIEIALNALNSDYAVWFDLVAIASAFAILVALWVLGNVIRGRPAFSRPRALGPFEVAFFVLVPAFVPVVFGQQARSAIGTSVLNVVILTLIYVFTSYAVFPMIRWGWGRLVRQLGAVVTLLARALPLIALLVTFLFLTSEVWQTAGELDGLAYIVAVLLFPLVGLMFLASRLPNDVGELNRFTGWDEITPLVAGTPVADVRIEAAAADGAVVAPLGRREWGNVGLVALFSQGLQIVLVSVLIGCFFVLLGVLLVDVTTTAVWVAPEPVHVLATLTVSGRDLVVTEQLLRVAGFLTAFTSMNFAVYLVTDETYRREFRQEVVGELRQAFAVRAVYRSYVAPPAGA